MEEYWKKAESLVEEEYKKKGYVVLNQNRKGFPDLIVIKDGKIVFFVEVKAKQEPKIEIEELQYHQYLNKLDFEVKCINVLDGKMKQFYPDPEWAQAVKETNPLLT